MSDEGDWHAAEVHEGTQIGAARRMAARLTEYAELPETRAGHVALVVVELAANLVKHATRGQLLIRVEGRQDRAVVDIMSMDQGPGMDLETCFLDGYSTGGTSGAGLGAVRRLASEFDAYSDSRGSVIFARFGQLQGPPRGSVALPIRGEIVNGDQWRFKADEEGWSLMVVDGLGHGAGAHAAACIAIGVHGELPRDPRRCLETAHERSHGSRGSACSVAAFSYEQNQLAHAGVGNVATTLVGRESQRGIPSQSGTLGAACPRVQQNTVATTAGSLLVMHTDGLTSRWSLDSYAGLRVRHPQVVAGTLFRDGCRQRDDATIVVIQT